MMMKISAMGREVELIDIIFAVFLVASLVWQNGYLGQLKQIPSPMYGGDYYNGLGGVNHILSGGNLLESAQMAGEPPWVPWMYHLSVSAFSIVSGLDPMHALIYFSIVVQIFTLITVYLLAAKVAGRKDAALLGAILMLLYFPVFKYSDFATVLVVPLFTLALAVFMERPDRKNALVAGLAMALMGLSNTQAFFVGIMMFGLAGICLLYPKLKGRKLDAGAILGERELLMNLGILFAAGFTLSLLFWFRPIFVYHGQTPNDIQNITYPDVTQMSIFMEQTYGFFVTLLAPFGFDFPGMLFSALNVAGLYFVIRKPEKYGIVLVLLLAGIACILHPMITEPLLKTQLMASMMFGRVATALSVLLAAIGLANLAERIKDRNMANGAVAICIVLAMVMANNVLMVKENDRWAEVGKTAVAEPHAELEAWIKENTDVNDVFITTNEDGFMMNALTGRKVVSYRRAHASPYTDMHQRMADQAVMAYGENTWKTFELLGKYDVKYLLVTYNWVSNEFRFGEDGQLVGFFDPLDVPDNATNRAYWDQNGVEYLQVTMSMDPAPPPNVPLYDLIVAMPYPLDSGGPVSPALMGNFRLVKTVYSEGYQIFQVYERVE